MPVRYRLNSVCVFGICVLATTIEALDVVEYGYTTALFSSSIKFSTISLIFPRFPLLPLPPQ